MGALQARYSSARLCATAVFVVGCSAVPQRCGPLLERVEITYYLGRYLHVASPELPNAGRASQATCGGHEPRGSENPP